MTAYDFHSAETRDQPFALFHQMRDHDPVYLTDFGYWYVSRYDDVTRLLRDTRLTSGQGVPDSFGLTEGPLRDIMDTWMMALDGPAHTKSRGLVSRAFTPRAVESLRAPVEALAQELVGALGAHGEGDIIDALAFPLPMEVTRMLFGVERALWDREITALFDRGSASVDYVEAMTVLAEFLSDYIPAHRATAGTDLFTALSSPDADGNVLSDLEQVANAVLLVTAGFETTMSLITNAVRTLLLHPDQVELLRADQSLVRSAVDEALRFEPAALFTTRVATEQIEVAGGVIPAGSNVMFSSIAANRDPARYPDPDRFDITRTDIRPVTFGGGVHVCIGASLARMEAEVAIATLFGELPGLRLADPVCHTFQGANPSVRRPETLRVTIDR